MFSTRICIIKEYWWFLISPWPSDVWKMFSDQPEIVFSTFIQILFLDTRGFMMFIDASKLQVHNIVSSNKVINKVSFPRGLDKTSTKIIVNLQLFRKSIKLEK